MLELENNPSLILPIGLNPVSQYGSTIKRRFLSFFMKINFAPYQFLSSIFVYPPPAAFPYIILQLGKIIRLFDYVYVQCTPSLSKKLLSNGS